MPWGAVANLSRSGLHLGLLLPPVFFLSSACATCLSICALGLLERGCAEIETCGVLQLNYSGFWFQGRRIILPLILINTTTGDRLCAIHKYSSGSPLEPPRFGRKQHSTILWRQQRNQGSRFSSAQAISWSPIPAGDDHRSHWHNHCCCSSA